MKDLHSTMLTRGHTCVDTVHPYIGQAALQLFAWSVLGFAAAVARLEDISRAKVEKL